ncbi:hypothetical protein CgunFtcFv8_013109 [Champsocephalus gunnari]|uniref:Uncharacterized protein n=1 Tax=Champsocephalus gunnari TaxID=52237 RepID=A0AAN8DWN0_CHAGU|nr:hypothetical protein CgunFtcFv8_013109 [Champsocephalus gunnari]
MKNKLWEHAGCDGTPRCEVVPGVAACLVCSVVYGSPTCLETGGVQIEKENTRLLIKNLNGFVLSLASCLVPHR